MKHNFEIRVFASVLAILFLYANTAVAEPAALDSVKKKVSYAIGQQMGSSVKKQGIDVDPDSLKIGIDDALKGKKSALSPAEIQEAMQQLQGEMMKKMQAQGKVNQEKGKKFLAENKKKKGVKTTASGLQYIVLKEGTGPNPKPTDKVKVHYRGTLLDGTEFDSSYKRNAPAEFPLNGVIKGWGEGIPLMKVGGKSKLFIPSELAYGPSGRPSIPPSSVLVFEVELLEIK